MKVDLASSPAIAAAPTARAPRARTSDPFSAAYADARDERDRRDAKRDDAAAMIAAAPPPPQPIEVPRHDQPVEAPRADDSRVEAKPIATKSAKDRAPAAQPKASGSDTASASAAEESISITVTVPGTPDAEIVNVPSIHTIPVPVIDPSTEAVTVPVTDAVAVAVAVAVADTVAVTGSGSGSGSESDSDSDSEPAVGGVADLVATLAPAPDHFALPAAAHRAAPADAIPTDSLAAQLHDQLHTDPTATSAADGITRARLVLGDDDRRVVVSVALRHGTVDVAIRADDPTLAHAVARSHGELDHALRGHGLALGDLSSRNRDRDRDRNPDGAPAPRTAAARFARGADEPTAATPTTSYPTDPTLRALA